LNTFNPDIIGPRIIEPTVFPDARGFLFESYNQLNFQRMIGQQVSFLQDNHTHSKQGVLRGLHYQLRRPQGKLIRVVAGEVFDVAVDLRRSSPTFRKWTGARLSADNKRMLWIPPGFAHGFLAMSDFAECLYKATDYWDENDEHCIAWNDSSIGIDWPLREAPTLSPRDRAGIQLNQAKVFD
jgi:dTDP-4-dehydrorhamnose 3,5-epimerase